MGVGTRERDAADILSFGPQPHSYGTSRRRPLLTSLLRWLAWRAMLLGFEGTGAKKATAGAARRKKLRTRMVSCVEGRGKG